MPTSTASIHAYRLRGTVRRARENSIAIAEVFGTVARAPVVSTAVIPFGPLNAFIPGARVEPTTVLP